MKALMLLLASFTVSADCFISIGAGVHSSKDRPEISLDRYVGIGEGGCTKDGWSLKGIHISGLKTKEEGIGFNGLFITKEWRF